jgi:hypothetical protein
LVNRAFDVLEDAMKQTDDDPNSVRMHNSRVSAAQTILNTQAKVDDTQLRKKQVDILPRLLEIIAQKEIMLPPAV